MRIWYLYLFQKFQSLVINWKIRKCFRIDVAFTHGEFRVRTVAMSHSNAASIRSGVIDAYTVVTVPIELIVSDINVTIPF